MNVRAALLLSGFAATLLLHASCSGMWVDVGPRGGAGGGAGAPGSGGASASGLPCGVERLLRDRCQQCHGPTTAFGAPMSLVTRDDLLAPSFSDPTVSAAARSLARVTEGGRPMPPPPNAPTSAAEVAALRAWVEASMPAATPGEACAAGGAGGAGGTVVAPLGCEPDVTLQAAEAYELGQDEADRYICFGAQMAPGPKRHIVAATPLVDDAAVVHHFLVFQVPEAEARGAAPERCASIFPPSWKMIYGWGPGGLPLELPPEAGFPTAEGAATHFVVQVHYSNLKREVGHRDRTGIGLCSTAELRPNDADIAAFGKLPFAPIPPNSKTTLSCDLALADLPGPVRVFRAWPHMHQRGESFRAEARHAAGGVSSLGAVLDYDFEHQISYGLDVTLAPGDTVRTECTWNNGGNPNPVGFGENTASEMCFNFLSYYPRIPGLATLEPASSGSNCTSSSVPVP